MSHYFTLGMPVIAGLFLLVSIWLKHRLDQQDKAIAEVIAQAVQAALSARDAATSADHAAQLSLPTSNGFASGMREGMARLEADSRATRSDIGGMRADFRYLVQRVDGLDVRLTHHEQESHK